MLSPMKAIRKYCVDDCCVGQENEVRECPVSDCELFSYRYGRSPGVKVELTSLKSIKAKCLNCGDGTYKDVRECWNTVCILHPYRAGKNPNLSGRAGNVEGLQRWRANKAEN